MGANIDYDATRIIFNDSIMKKFLTRHSCTRIFPVFLMIFSLTLFSCGKRDQSRDVSGEVEEAVPVIEEVENQVEEEESVSTETWHLYETDYYTIKYPDGFEPAEYKKLTTFNPRDYTGGAFFWTVNIFQNRKDTMENLITGMGAQYAKDRNVERDDIKIDQLPALRVLITTERDADFYYEAVLVETDENVYFISNTQKKDPAFTAFYGSFRLK